MKRLVIVAAVLTFIVVGCKGRDGAAPEITIGTTTCSACQRVIADATLASTARLPDGSVQAFDTTRCLLKTIPQNDDWHVWFHDKDGPGWIQSSKAFFVIQRTGPGGGIVAINTFVDRDHASAFYKRTPGRNELVADYDTLRGVVSTQ